MFDSLHLDISTYSDIIDQPQATSSPKPTINVNKKQKVAKKKASQRLTILNINCQSVKSKVPDLHQVIHHVKPDIIVGTESWLTSDITNSEIFPKDLYTIYRKDRTGRKGVCVYSWQSQLTSYHQNNLSWTLIANHPGKSRYNRCKIHLHRGIL